MGREVEEFVATLGWEIDTSQLKLFQRQAKSLKSSVMNMWKPIAAGAVATGFALQKVMKAFSMLENAQASFTPVLRSVEKAKQLVNELTETAATTPFQFGVLSDAAKQLLPNMDGDIQRTIERVRMLGDTAGGEAFKMRRIVLGYNKALLKTRVDMESLNIITEAGVPILHRLGTVVGKTGVQLFEEIRRGKVTTDQLTEAFKQMTGKGGMFFKGMEIASKTLTGRISTLKDNVTLAAADFGDALAPSVKEAVEELLVGAGSIREWVRENKALIRVKATSYFKEFLGLARGFVDMGKDVFRLIDRLGGLERTVRHLAVAWGILKLSPILTTMGGIIVAAPKLGAVLEAAGNSAFVAWAKVAGILAGAYLLWDDADTFMRSGESAIGDYLIDPINDAIKSYFGLTDAHMKFVEAFQATKLRGGYIETIKRGFGLLWEMYVDYDERFTAGINNLVSNVIEKFKFLFDSVSGIVKKATDWIGEKFGIDISNPPINRAAIGSTASNSLAEGFSSQRSKSRRISGPALTRMTPSIPLQQRASYLAAQKSTAGNVYAPNMNITFDIPNANAREVYNIVDQRINQTLKRAAREASGE